MAVPRTRPNESQRLTLTVPRTPAGTLDPRQRLHCYLNFAPDSLAGRTSGDKSYKGFHLPRDDQPTARRIGRPKNFSIDDGFRAEFSGLLVEGH
jgi:hypothetical protein